MALETFGIDRLLFGTDWPFWKGEAHQLAADYLERSGLGSDDIARIDCENAKALFRERFPL